MPVELSIQGADRLGLLANHLKATGNGGLRKELYAGINRAIKPLKAAVQEAARETLPKAGGLNEFVAGAKITTSIRAGVNPGVRIKAAKTGHDLKAIDAGRLRHPVHGHKDRWVTQDVPPGWFTKTLESKAPVVHTELAHVLEDVAQSLHT